MIKLLSSHLSIARQHSYSVSAFSSKLLISYVYYNGLCRPRKAVVQGPFYGKRKIKRPNFRPLLPPFTIRDDTAATCNHTRVQFFAPVEIKGIMLAR